MVKIAEELTRKLNYTGVIGIEFSLGMERYSSTSLLPGFITLAITLWTELRYPSLNNMLGPWLDWNWEVPKCLPSREW